jgi:hypothetical protein
VEEIMSLLKDLLKTASDAMRLSSDVMRYRVEMKTRAVKRGISRVVVCIGMGLVALGFVGAGIGLLLHGAFILVANELGPGLSGLIVGVASILLAGFLLLVGCGSLRRS